jgi:hypothetical protein
MLAAAVQHPPQRFDQETDFDPFDDTWHIDDDNIWNPEDAISEEPIFMQQQRMLKLPKIPSLTPSQFTSFAFYMPADDGIGETGLGFNKFTFKGRRHMERIYNTGERRILLKCARQVEKSTYLGNRALCYMSIIPSFKVLYVSPSATQTTTFSNDRIKEPLETSPVLRRFTTTMLSSNILEKQLVNRSKMTMRYAFLNADRARGIPAWMLEIDEFQDVLSDNIPVIEQCLSHAPEQWKQFIYAGTPKSLDNNIETYWANHSTQNEWAVPHDCKGGEGGRFWNVLGEKNIGKKGLICENCGTLIDAMHPDAQWARMVKSAPFEGYRIPQLMVPWKKWSEILLDYKRYPRDKFYNEVLGISYDSGLRPLTRGQMKDCCNPAVKMSEIEQYRKLSYSQPVFAGIDWGTGEHSYSVISLGTYINSVFRIFFIHRFEGEDVDPPRQLARIDELIRYFNVKVVGADYGGGYDRNDHLVRQIGPKRLQKFQYMANFNKKVAYDPKLGRWKLARTEVMSDVFNAIKRMQQGQRVIEFPCWEEFQDPYAMDCLNIFSEYNKSLRKIQYKHSQDKPDDAFHSILYCWLGSMILIPRPDIIAPVQEKDGVPVRRRRGTIDQG